MSVVRGTERNHFEAREADEAFDEHQAERSATRVSGAYRVRLRADGDIDFEDVIEEGREALPAIGARGPSVGARLAAAPISDRARFEAVFTGLPLALFVVDPEGQVQYVNSRARALLSWAPKLLEIARSRALGVMRGEAVESEVTSVRLPNGAMSTFRLRTGDVRFTASPAWAVVVVEDVTADSKAEEARRLDEKFREMFVGILGHDLRTPLSSILTAASLAKRRAASADQGRLADIMLRSCRRMARLIEDILDMTQGRLGGGVRVFAEPTELSQIVGSAVEAIEGAAPSGLIEVSNEGSSAGEWDPGRLLQVLTNLLKNALDYGAPLTKIRVHIDGVSENHVTVSVNNQGVPLAPELIPMIFDPFRRGGRSGKEQGLGLGLYIAERIVTAHDGQISVHSSREEGTTFLVTLPRTPAPSPD